MLSIISVEGIVELNHHLAQVCDQLRWKFVFVGIQFLNKSGVSGCNGLILGYYRFFSIYIRDQLGVFVIKFVDCLFGFLLCIV